MAFSRLHPIGSFPAFVLACMAVQAPARAEGPVCPPPVSHIVMQSGSFGASPGVTFRLQHFDATISSAGKTSPACFERLTEVSRGRIFVNNESLTTLFSAKLATANDKISDLKITNGPDGVTISGKVKKAIPIFFSISGPVTTNGSEIRMDAKTIKADGIPVKMLMAMVGEDLNAMLQLRGLKGMKIEEDSMSFSPEAVAHLRGHIASVSTSNDGMTLLYAPDHTRHPASVRH